MNKKQIYLAKTTTSAHQEEYTLPNFSTQHPSIIVLELKPEEMPVLLALVSPLSNRRLTLLSGAYCGIVDEGECESILVYNILIIN